MAELRCEHLAKSYGARQVLRNVNLTVPSGSLTAILGASGSGKTTLLRLVLGLASADAGSIAIGGVGVAAADGTDVRADKRSVGYVAQEGALFPHLSVAQNVGFGLPRRERRQGTRIEQVLRLVGLDASYGARAPHELSGGEQRRVALARALAPRPRLMLLDEPFSSLDAALRVETRHAISAALSSEGTTTVLVTHDQSEALSMGDQVAVLSNGELVQCASPKTIYREPQDIETARFLGEAVIVPGRASHGSVVCDLGVLAIGLREQDGPVTVLIRPEQIKIVSRQLGAALDGVAATVVGHSFHGPHTLVRLSLAPAPHREITAMTLDLEVPGVGERVSLLVDGPVLAYPSDEGLDAQCTVLKLDFSRSRKA